MGLRNCSYNQKQSNHLGQNSHLNGHLSRHFVDLHVLDLPLELHVLLPKTGELLHQPDQVLKMVKTNL